MQLKPHLASLVLTIALLAAGCTAPTTPSAPNAHSSASTHQPHNVAACPDTDMQAAHHDGGLPTTDLPCLGTNQRVNLAGLPHQAFIINLWAQWCQPCRKEAAFIREAAEQLPDIHFLGINYNDPQPEWAMEFAELVQWKYPHVQDQDRTLQTPLRVAGIPTTLFVSAEGKIVYTHVGPFSSSKQIRDLAAQYLSAR